MTTWARSNSSAVASILDKTQTDIDKINAMELPSWVDRDKDIKVAFEKDANGKDVRTYVLTRDTPSELLRANVLRLRIGAKVRWVEAGRTVEIDDAYYVVIRAGSLIVKFHEDKSVTTIDGTAVLRLDYTLTRGHSRRHWRTA